MSRIHFFYSIVMAFLFLIAFVLTGKSLYDEFLVRDELFPFRSVTSPEQAKQILNSLKKPLSRETEAELLIRLATGAVNRKEYDAAAEFARMALETKAEDDYLFRAGAMLGYCDFFRHRDREGRERLSRLLKNKKLPEDLRLEIIQVLEWDQARGE